jgi:hypothetical protein
MHAEDFYSYAYLQTGQLAKAEALTAKMVAIGDQMTAMPGMDDMKDWGAWFDSESRAIFAMETHQWARLAALQPEPGAQAQYLYHVYWGVAWPRGICTIRSWRARP